MDQLRPDLRAVDEAAHGKRGRRRRRGVSLLPSLFTLGNLMCGFASIDFAARGAAGSLNAPFSQNFMYAGYLILLAMVFDVFDGFIARLTRSTSNFGAELDSLADVVSFGVAPAFLSIHVIGQLVITPLGEGKRNYLDFIGPFSDDAWMRLFWVIAGTYVACTALRLARFNVSTKADVSSHMAFRGMPSPGAAAIVAGSVMFFESLGLSTALRPRVGEQVLKGLVEWFPYVLPVMLLVSALLMVSSFSYAHLVNRFARGRKRFRTLVGFVLVLMLVAWQPQISLIVGIYVYALSAPVMALFQKISGRGKLASTSTNGHHGTAGHK
jgi:CDP-diacylglycerol---serine O-phosphatidyltransferase